MRKGIATKIMGYLLTATMIAGSISLSPMATVEAQAAVETKNVNLNVGNSIAGIGNPDSTATTKWTGSRVYLGNKLWRVLDKNHVVSGKNAENTYNNYDAMFLFSEGFSADDKEYHNWQTSVTWATCKLRKNLNGDNNDGGLYAATFTNDIEKKAIITSHIDNPDNGSTPGGDSTNDKLFLLSLGEVQNSSYGMPKSGTTDYNKTRVDKDGNNMSSWWWLRSPGSDDNYAVYVLNDGDVYSGGAGVSNDKGSVRPALNLDLSSVLFSSVSGADKSSFEPTVNSFATTWNLTLQGTPSTLEAIRTAGNTELQVGYSDRMFSFSHKKANELNNPIKGYENTQVSAMLTDSEGTVLYYGLISSRTEDTTSDVTIPAGLPIGSYSLYVFAEDVNSSSSSNATDYASAFGTPIPITVSAAPAPSANISDITVDGVTETPITERDVTVSLTNAKFSEMDQNADVSGWFTNKPSGISAKIKNAVATDATSAAVTISGTPSTISSNAMEVIINSHLQGGGSLAVTTNNNAKWAITEPEQVSVPTFDPVGGTYHTTQNVALSSTTEGATIYYTTNGDNPTASSTQYQSGTPIVVSESKTIKAIAVKSGMTGSETASASYVIEAPAPGSHAITTRVSPLNGGSITGGGSVADGGSTTLSATANKGYKFVKWLKGDSVVSTSSSYEVTNVREDAEYIAVFKKKASTPQNDDEEESRPSGSHSGGTQQSPQDILQFTYSADPTHAKIWKAKQGPLCELAFRMATPAGYQEAFSFNLFHNP